MRLSLVLAVLAVLAVSLAGCGFGLRSEQSANVNAVVHRASEDAGDILKASVAGTTWSRTSPTSPA